VGAALAMAGACIRTFRSGDAQRRNRRHRNEDTSAAEPHRALLFLFETSTRGFLLLRPEINSFEIEKIIRLIFISPKPLNGVVLFSINMAMHVKIH
jgi:hypothetical protein